MAKLHVLLDFASGSDHNLEVRSGAVHSHLYNAEGAAAYPEPPVSATDLLIAIDAFKVASGKARVGSPADTATKNNKREALVVLMRDLADYVDGEHGDDLAKLLLSGFEAASTNRSPSPLDAPTNVKVKNGGPGQLIVSAKRPKNAQSLEVRVTPVAENGTHGPVQNGGVHTDSRRMIVNGLTPGDNYLIEVRGVGGSEGYSPWSDPVMKRSL